MAHEIIDFQRQEVIVANTTTESVLYSFNVLPASIDTIYLYRLILTGKISTKASAPGAITLRHKFSSHTVTVVNETPLTSLAAKTFICNLDCWLMPGESMNVISLSGFLLQNGADIFTVAGPRVSVADHAEVDLSVSNVLQTTVQWATNDAANIFTVTLAALTTITG